MDKNSYALGMSIAHNMISSGIKEISFDDFTAGLKAVLTGAEPAVSFQEASQLLDKYFAEIEKKQQAEALAMGAAMREEGEIFLADYSRITIGETCFPIGSAYLNDISFIQVFVHERINALRTAQRYIVFRRISSRYDCNDSFHTFFHVYFQ